MRASTSTPTLKPISWTTEGWLYLAVVLDLFSRRVVVNLSPEAGDAQHLMTLPMMNSVHVTVSAMARMR